MGMNILAFGPNGSGKGTQGAIVKEKYNIPHIESGAIFREHIGGGTELGKKAKEVMDRGELVSDEIVLGLLEERLSSGGMGNGFILDGYPRNLAQAEALNDLLERIGQPVDEALQIDVDEESVVERIAKRAALEGRSDDTEETVRNRLKVYADQTAPVVEFYANKGILSRVLGEGSIEEVFQRIKGVLQINSDS